MPTNEEQEATRERPDGVRVVPALIGWSNHRSGCEFYELRDAPRWERREHPHYVFKEDEPTGRLLTDALRDPEGATAVVVLLPRGEDPADTVSRIEAALQEPSR